MLDKIKGCLFYKKNELKEIKESVVEMKESIKNIQESIVLEENESDENIDLDTKENIKYAKYLKNEILTEKSFLQKFKEHSFVLFLIIVFSFVYIIFFTQETCLKKVYELTVFPSVIFILTNMTAMNIQDLKSKHNLKLKFIEVVKPLYIEGSLKKEPELEQFYMKLLNLCESDRN